MKLIINLFLITVFTASLFPQNHIINTLGTNGVFAIKDNSNTYFLRLYQSTGDLDLSRSMVLPNTTGSTIGVIYKGGNSFLHNYGSNNTFLGIVSGNFTMTGAYNTAVGEATLYRNTTGSYNSGFGFNSLNQNSAGSNNSAFGYYSLRNNTTGVENSAFGSGSLSNNTTGYYNSAFGYVSLTSNFTGYSNSAFGHRSLQSSNGHGNSAFGIGSLMESEVADGNSSFGYYSLQLNFGNYNSAFGYLSMESNYSGAQNSAFGRESLRYNTFGHYNSAFGIGSLWQNTTGSYNSALGNNAGKNITTGSNNIAIGSLVDVPSGTASNQVRIGYTNITYAGIQVPWSVTSDRRVKSNILSSNLGLNFITALRPVSYERTNDEKKRTEYGFIAQEVDEVLKKNGVENSGLISVDDEGTYSMRYNDLIAPMVKAIQELKAENDKYRNEVEYLNSMNENVARLEQMINDLNSKKETSLSENK